MEGMILCAANFVPLTPISFLERAAFVYGQRVSIVFGNTRFLWKETHERCVKLASALSELGITRDDIIVAIAPNIPELYELHFGVPMAGAVLCTLNTKLNAITLALKLEQLEPKTIFVEYKFFEVVLQALGLILSQKKRDDPIIVLMQEINRESSSTRTEIEKKSIPAENKILDYDKLLTMGQIDFKILYPKVESDPISINYTSGSTGMPKGVIYSHRAAYLNSLAQAFGTQMRQMPVFLWTVDMFRCNGWCFPWTMAALGGTNFFLREITGKSILEAIFIHNVTHFCGPPALLSQIYEAASADQRPLPSNVDAIVAGPMPHAQIRSKLEELGFNVTSAYGMSEALGPVTSRLWKFQDDFESLSRFDEEDEIKIREGIHNIMIEGVDIKDPVTMESVPFDGKTIGEVMFRSNTMMSGYFKNLQATKDAFQGGWYRTKDLGVRNPDGFIQIKDRDADGIFSGGEMISSLEVEAVLVRHPKVLEAAVVGKPDDLLGEMPCAFVRLKEGFCATAEEIMSFCATCLQDYMVPKCVFFENLPVNSTGKIQKFVLRDRFRRD